MAPGAFTFSPPTSKPPGTMRVTGPVTRAGSPGTAGSMRVTRTSPFGSRNPLTRTAAFAPAARCSAFI